MPHTTQRFEFNRSLSRILARHSVNLNRLAISINGPLIRLSGGLERHPYGAFDVQEIRALLRDLEALPFRLLLQFHLDDWRVEKLGGVWRIDRHGADPADEKPEGAVAPSMEHARYGEPRP